MIGSITHSSGICFNPHPARRLDATAMHTVISTRYHACFNPHPARRLDATRCNPEYVSILIQPEGWMLLCMPNAVSILIQPEGWMLPTVQLNTVCTYYMFQSSSSPKAGCYDATVMRTRIMYQFQSSSSPKAGCYVIIALLSICKMFQSSSSPKAGCYQQQYLHCRTV